MKTLKQLLWDVKTDAMWNLKTYHKKKVSSRHTTKHYYLITSGRKHKQARKNAIAEKKINARWTENALHKM